MSILIDKNTKIIVQGITGKAGAFHALECMKYGSNIIGGVTPGKGGQAFEKKIPIFDSVIDAVDKTGANATLVFVPPSFASDSILEAIDASIDLIVVITEGIPVRDMAEVKTKLARSQSRMIGPNCPGIITPGECKMGIMPSYIHKPGKIGIVSRSGTLTYEAVWQLTSRGYGQSTCLGIGGDPITGTTHTDAIKLFNEDSETEAIIMIGEIGGDAEENAAAYIKDNVKKPIVAFIAGITAPPNRRMGHAGAVISGGKGTAMAKIETLANAGVAISPTPSEITETLFKIYDP